MKRVLLLMAVALAGCGTSTGSSSVDPATVAPPSTLAYASFEIAPDGPEKTNFDAAFGKLLGADPETKLGQAFTQATQTSGKLDYQRDVEPWLGKTLSVVVTRVGPRGADFALLAASTDDDKARAAVDRDLAGTKALERSYRDVPYKLLDDGTANGVIDHFLVAGSETTFKAVVDAAKDGDSLADSDRWHASVGDRGAGKVGLAYVDLKALLQSFASQLDGAQRVAGPLLLGLLKINPFVATLDATPDALVADVSSPGTKPDPRGPQAGSSPLIEALPPDSWFALALPDVGGMLGKLGDVFKANPLIAAQYANVLARVKAKTGIDLERDVIAAVGDVGLFARGATPSKVGGGLVIGSQKPAVLARTVARLPALIRSEAHGRVRVTSRSSGFDVSAPQMPQPIQVRVSDGGVLAAYGAASTRSAVQPRGRLGDTALFRKAAIAVGQRPTLFVAFGPALNLAAASPHHRDDAHFKRALPKLQHIEYAAVGVRRDNGLDVVRAVLGLR